MRTFFYPVFTGLLAVASTPIVAAETQTLGVRESVAEQMSPAKLHDRYKPLADFITQVIGKKTLVDASQEAQFILDNMKSAKYAVMFVRPSGLTGRAIREDGFTLVAEARDELYASFIVPRDSPLKRPEDLAGKRIAMPDRSAFITKVGFAALRDAHIDTSKLDVQYTRYQDSAVYTVDTKLADAALVSSVVAKAWEKKGGRTLFRSKRVPSWAIIASPKLAAADIAKLRSALLTMDTSDSGRKVLSQIGVAGFMSGKAEEYVALTQWIGI